MTTTISTANLCDFAAGLAELQVELDINQTQVAKQQRDAARESYLKNVQAQVDELHEAANATRTGALINASMQVAGSACELGAMGVQYRIDSKPCAASPDWVAWAKGLGKVGDGLTKLGGPLQAFVGDSSAADHQAEAKRYESLAAQAQWQDTDTSAEIEKANKQLDKILGFAEGIQRDQNQSNNAIIGRI